MCDVTDPSYREMFGAVNESNDTPEYREDALRDEVERLRSELADLQVAHEFQGRQFEVMRREKEHGWREAERFETGLERASAEIATLKAAENIESLLANYLTVRGKVLRHAALPPAEAITAQADYVCGEAEELTQAAWTVRQLGNDPKDECTWRSVRLELADVVLAATVLARYLDTTVEACIEEKTEADRGRG